MSERYILENGEPVPCDDLILWAKWMETADRHIALTETENGKVSTVFLGLNYNFGPSDRPPVLFESIVFGGSLDGEMDRYTNRVDAEYGHETLVERVRSELSKNQQQG